MVIRYLIICSTCNTPITIRIWVGHNPSQRHVFLCPNCKEEITVGMDVDFVNTRTKIRLIENCEHGTEEGKVFNLNPHFVIDHEQADSDLSFPWMEQALYIQAFSGLKLPERPKGVSGPIMLDSYEQLGGISNIIEMWKIIKKGWSLLDSKQTILSNNVLKKYSEYGYEDECKLENILFDFCVKLLVPKKLNLFSGAMETLKNAKENHTDELLRFREYYQNKLKNEHFRRHFEVFSEYFKEYSEYDQTILYIKNVVPVPEGCHAASAGFRNTKMFYGNAFESYTSNISVLACLNNIVEGRPFDEFREMNLAKYLTINKAGRCAPFSTNENLCGYLDCIDSTLRNASHHGSMSLKKHRSVVEYRSGGTGQRHEMSYSNYLEMCGKIMLSSAALLMVELVIIS